MSLIRTTYLAAPAVLILGCSGPAQSAGLKVPWLDGASLGMGYDAKSGSLTGETCAKVQPTAEVSRNTSDFSFLRADSKDELITKMSGSIGGEAKFVAYGGSARASFASSLDIRRSDTTILVANEVTSEEVGSSLAEPVERGDDLVRFRRRCGTHYVSTVVYGGELLMALQASEQTLDAKDEFEASVKGTVGAASGTAQFQQSKQRLESRKGLRITGRKAGGDGNQSYNLETFVTEVSTFREQVLLKENRKSHVFYVVVTPYVGFAGSNTKSTTVDNAVNKLMFMDDKLNSLQQVTVVPTMYNVDPAGLSLVAEERNRLQAASDRLRNDIEACVYPNSVGTAADACEKLNAYSMPPTHAMGDGIPERFASDCRKDEINVPSMSFGHSGNGKRLQGDGLIGGRMLIEFQIVPSVVDERIVRVLVTQKASEPGTSKKSAEEDIVEFYETANIERIPGCIVVGVPQPISTKSEWFAHGQTRTYTAGVDTVTCRSTARGGGTGMRARSYDAFVCDASFLPLRGVSFVNEELFDQGKIKQRETFKKLPWLSP